MTPDSRPIIDAKSGTLDLGNGYYIGWAIDADGDRHPWLMRNDLCDNCESSVTHGNLADAAHEMAGPLPVDLRRRLDARPRSRPGTNRRFEYIEGAAVTHIAVWTGQRWKVPCNMVPSSWPRITRPTRRFCRTCARATRVEVQR